MKPPIQIVWFKRDLRLSDHAALAAAAKSDVPVLLLYCFEPTVMAAPEWDVRHWRFVWQCLEYMRSFLGTMGLRMEIFAEDIGTVFCALAERYDIAAIHSHQETNLAVTFERDLAVGKWCKANRIAWTEHSSDGIQRGKRRPKDWQESMTEYLKSPVLSIDWKGMKCVELPPEMYERLSTDVPAEFKSAASGFQPGGERWAWRYLDSFARERVVNYSKHISKPTESRKSCSRLSPYLAYGCVSARQVWQFVEHHKSGANRRAVENFQSRVYWRSHFMQKLENDFQQQWLHVNRGFEGLVRNGDEALFRAWAEGRTGFPMVDASMRSVMATGYLNFRMRAMLVTFLSFTLWQDWRKGALHLARQFLDFEPGIHYPQFQMQSGSSGYHTMRIYNPTAQCEKHDPEGVFVRKWLPELANVPAPLIYEPWKMTEMEQVFYGCSIGVDYPAPVVDFETASRTAKDTYWAFRQKL